MTRFAKAVLIFVGAWGLAGPAAAFTVGGLGQAPNELTYQGRLIESGVPASGPRTVTISLCDAPTAGTCFSSGAQGVLAASGLFRTTFTVPASVNLGNLSWWLEVQVGAATLSPRERLTSSPYAVVASSAGTLALSSPFGVSISTNLGLNTVLPQTGLHLVGTLPGQAVLLLDTSVTGDFSGVRLNPSGPAGGSFIELGRTGAGFDSRIEFRSAGQPAWELRHANSAFQNRLDLVNPPLGGPPQMSFATNGGVGVGGANPIARLHVSTPSAQPGELLLAVSTNTNPGSEALAVFGTGDVAVSTRLAIGKNFPGDALDIATKGDGGIKVNSLLGGHPAAVFLQSGTPKTVLRSSVLGTQVGSLDNSPAHVLTNAQPRLTVTPTGQVGIGTTNPAAGTALAVVGGSTSVQGLDISGPVRKSVVTYNGSNTVAYSDNIVIAACPGACTITLPAASAATIGQEFVIISSAGANSVSLGLTVPDNATGATAPLTSSGQKFTVYGTGVNSWIVGN